MKKRIAWGASKLLEMYLNETKSHSFSYCIDSFSDKENILGLPIKKIESLSNEEKGGFEIVIFGVSNSSLQEISEKLNDLNLAYKDDFIYYSDLFYDDFVEKVKKRLGFSLDPILYRYALAYTLNSKTLMQTTILGTWLFLEILKRVNDIEGEIAEVGSFQGGNALCSLQFMTNLKQKDYYIFDSFEGFPDVSEHDPETCSKGDLKIETTLQEVLDTFSKFPNAKVIKGFVPKTFSMIPEEEKFSLVFYDCDLYQPALDTFSCFWDKIVPGGYLIIHDYEVEEKGYNGVKKATKEFFTPKNMEIVAFFENTMAIIKKE